MRAGTGWPDAHAAPDGAVLHVARDPGSRSGQPTLVFVNSLGCDLRIWAGVVGRLRHRAAILRYDKRGHGLSEIGRPPYTMDGHAGDLISLLETLDGPAIVCGLSIGGMIAMRAAQLRPDLIGGLILCDTGARIGTPERYRAREAAIRADGMDAFADGQMLRWFSPEFADRAPATVRMMRAMLTRQSVTGYLGSVAALRDTDLTPHLGAIACPTLCLVGGQDTSTPPAAMRALAAGIPGATFAEIDGAGHLPCLEAPDEMAMLIAAFLDKNG